MTLFNADNAALAYHRYDMEDMLAGESPERSRHVEAYRIDSNNRAMVPARVGIAHINIDAQGHVILTPDACRIDGATDLAVLLHSYDVKTDPGSAASYGHSVKVAPGQLSHLLGVMVKHGFGKDIAKEIAREQGNKPITPPRLLRKIQYYDVERDTGVMPIDGYSPPGR